MSSFLDCRITHIFREGNSLADNLANVGAATQMNAFYKDIQQLPHLAKGAYILDILQVPGIR